MLCKKKTEKDAHISVDPLNEKALLRMSTKTLNFLRSLDSGRLRGGGGGAEWAEARGPTNLHFSKSFSDKKYFRFLEKVFTCKNYQSF